MPFINELMQYKSCSIVGMEKNTGKTECLNYVLRHIPCDKKRVAITSIGIDGETTDQVTRTSKPEIFLREGMWFATTEKHYRMRHLHSELLNISNESTSLGRVVTAKALAYGKVLISGPSSIAGLRRWMKELSDKDVDLILIDGALSRLSLASPAVSESMILATGAACSANINTLVQKTVFLVELINLPLTSEENIKIAENIENGVFVIDDDNNLHDLHVVSSLQPNLNTDGINHCKSLFVGGALTDNFLNHIKSNKIFNNCELIVRDFTKIFTTPMVFKNFCNNGHKVSVLQRSKLLAVVVNPTSPSGFVLDSEKLCEKLQNAINLPVYDLLKNNECN